MCHKMVSSQCGRNPWHNEYKDWIHEIFQKVQIVTTVLTQINLEWAPFKCEEREVTTGHSVCPSLALNARRTQKTWLAVWCPWLMSPHEFHISAFWEPREHWIKVFISHIYIDNESKVKIQSDGEWCRDAPVSVSTGFSGKCRKQYCDQWKTAWKPLQGISGTKRAPAAGRPLLGRRVGGDEVQD